MDSVVSIIVILSVLWCVVKLTKTAVGVHALRISRFKAEVMSRMNGRSGMPEPQGGISVIVFGMPTESDIKRLLGLDFDNYEVVVIADLAAEESARQIIKTYSMTRVNPPSAAEFPCRALRSLLRSRQRRYRKLVIGDCAAPRAEALNCGISVSTFGRIMILEKEIRLRRCALRRMDAEFETGTQTVGAVSAPVIDARLLECDSAVKIVSGDYSQRIYLIDKDHAVSIGGFSVERESAERLTEYMSEIPGLRHYSISDPMAIAPDLKRKSGIEGSKIAAYLLLCIITIAVMLCVLLHRWDLIATLIASLWMLYCTMIAVGIISMYVVRKIANYSLSEMLTEPFIYPFYPNRGSLLEKNF